MGTKNYRELFGFDVGDTIKNCGWTAIVSRIDPACDNVFIVGERDSVGNLVDPGAEREIAADCWQLLPLQKADGFKSAVITTTRARPSHTVVTLFANRHELAYHKRGVMFTLPLAPSAGTAKVAIAEIAADLAPDDYTAIVAYGDGDVSEFKFTVAEPEPVPPTNTVKFA